MDVRIAPESGDGIAVLNAVGSAANIRHILECCGQSIQNAAVRGARSKGGRRFWGEIANSVSHQTAGSQLTVGASHYAAGFKQTGGIIRAPGRGAGSLHRRALTIPVGIARERRWDTDEAESNGYTLFRQKDVIFGAEPAGGAAVPLFVLRRQVTQQADPWFPEGAALSAAIQKAIDFFAAGHGGAPVSP